MSTYDELESRVHELELLVTSLARTLLTVVPSERIQELHKWFAEMGISEVPTEKVR